MVLNDPTVRVRTAAAPAGGSGAGPWHTTSAGPRQLFRLDPTLRRTVLGDVTVSNGLAWTADGAHAYYIDTPTGRIDLFDADGAAGLSDRRPFVRIDPADGHPDGLTLDAEGRVWVALFGGSAVRCYSPDGALVEVVDLPAPKVTACTFGGPELDELFITTSRQGDSPEAHPAAGAVFRHRSGVRGVRVNVRG